MIQTLNQFSSSAKTAEIMSRYRPIAPKPEISMNPSSESENPSMSQKIRDSPYLRSVWPHMQARPTRTRKRGRTSLAPPPPSTMVKRPRTTTHHLLTLLSPSSSSSSTTPAKTHALQAFSHCGPGPNGLGVNPTRIYQNFVSLPLLSCQTSIPMLTHQQQTTTIEMSGEKGVIDLNMVAHEIPEERDLLQNFKGNVIAPKPIRPIGSSIRIGSIREESGFDPGSVKVMKKREEVEEEVESEALPAVVSDSNNKVRMANSAYKEMVGQPECGWLDCMGNCDGSCKRISGEVMLQFTEEEEEKRVKAKSNGFSCWVRIEWGSNDGKKSSSIKAFSDVMRLSCESGDYLFAWRFHTKTEF